MSKQSEAKDAQGYTMAQATCANCASYVCETNPVEGAFGRVFLVENKKRCALGGFAVKKTATCKKFEVAG